MKRIVMIIALLGLIAAMVGCVDEEYSYITKHGMMVSVGKINNPGPKKVEFWTDATILLWLMYDPSMMRCMYESVADTHAYYYDEDHIMLNGQMVGGWALPGEYHASNGDEKKFIRATVHELSHIFVGECAGLWDINGSHAVMKEQGVPF